MKFSPMKLSYLFLSAAFLFSTGIFAQKNCGTAAPGEQWDAWFNQKVAEHRQNVASGKTQNTNYTIPVIVHVIHGGQNVGVYPNISKTQVNSQITVLNNDFAGVGFNVANLAATGFSTVGAADCSISFCMAQFGPNGDTLPEWGIDRVNFNSFNGTNPAASSFNTQAAFQNYIDGVLKPATIWDPTRYFNIWVTDVANGLNLLGYATFPSGAGLSGINSSLGNAATDGIWVYSRAFGNTGTLVSPYNRGRTATHETGHYLGLRHIGGDASPPSCSSTDFCNDTPPQKGGNAGGAFGQNFGAPAYPLFATGPNACAAAPFGNMFMNFMDYVDDAFCYMFTPDQSARMTTAMNNGVFRNQLSTSSATLCDVLTSVAPQSNFSFPSTVCDNSLTPAVNVSSGVPDPSYLWSINPPGSAFVSPNTLAANPNISFSNPGTYTITLSASNSLGTSTRALVVNVSTCVIGIKNNEALQNYITLSPNPSSGLVRIFSSSNSNQVLDIAVHSCIGSLITSATMSESSAGSTVLDMSDYANGIYFVSISNGQEKIVRRLIINK
jgi:hypothetical protein